ncbi:hypothetical protein Ocin01_12240, partial [Orchesella cincta]
DIDPGFNIGNRPRPGRRPRPHFPRPGGHGHYTPSQILRGRSDDLNAFVSLTGGGDNMWDVTRKKPSGSPPTEPGASQDNTVPDDSFLLPQGGDIDPGFSRPSFGYRPQPPWSWIYGVINPSRPINPILRRGSDIFAPEDASDTPLPWSWIIPAVGEEYFIMTVTTTGAVSPAISDENSEGVPGSSPAPTEYGQSYTYYSAFPRPRNAVPGWQTRNVSNILPSGPEFDPARASQRRSAYHQNWPWLARQTGSQISSLTNQTATTTNNQTRFQHSIGVGLQSLSHQKRAPLSAFGTAELRHLPTNSSSRLSDGKSTRVPVLHNGANQHFHPTSRP